MAEVEALDYETELKSYCSKLKDSREALQRILNTFVTDSIHTFKNLRTNTLNSLEEREEVKRRIEEVRQGIKQCGTDQTHQREGAKVLERQLEKLNVVLQCKNEELERHKERLAECTEEIKKAEMSVSETRSKDQRKLDQSGSSIQLFKTNLGLDITHVRNNALILKFTQVSHFQPEKEFMLEMTLDGDNYCLVRSEPPLPSLPQLEEELNTSGNLLACIVKIRKLYERMDSKRPSD